MRRKFEFLFYLIILVYFVGKYSVTPELDRASPKRSVDRSPVETIAPERRTAKIRQTTQPVVVDVPDKTSDASGTAFAFDGYGQFITARHVVDGCSQVYVLTGAKKGKKAQQVVSEASTDFAVLNGTNLKTPRVDVRSKIPSKGDHGFMMGYPQGKPADVWAVAFGVTRMTSRGRYNIQEPVVAWVEKQRYPLFSGSLGGMSGGPVFNSQGEVVGTVVAGSPRRGRIYTTHPRNFIDTQSLAQSDMKSIDSAQGKITPNNYTEYGDSMREQLTIAKVYCKVEKVTRRGKKMPRMPRRVSGF